MNKARRRRRTANPKLSVKREEPEIEDEYDNDSQSVSSQNSSEGNEDSIFVDLIAVYEGKDTRNGGECCLHRQKCRKSHFLGFWRFWSDWLISSRKCAQFDQFVRGAGLAVGVCSELDPEIGKSAPGSGEGQFGGF